jgi:hypothetical protein
MASIPNTMDEFYDRIWAKVNAVPEYRNQDKKPQ